MIKFIFFDVGGVVIKDFSGTEKWNELKKVMGVKEDKMGKCDSIFYTYQPDICVGMETDTLVPIFEQELNVKLPSDYSLLQEFVIRFERNESLWPTINKIKKLYKIGLLTNMYPRMLDNIYKADLMPEIKWDVIIDSSVEKVRKPQIEIFQLAEKKCGYHGNEILFVDNGEENIRVARQFGWQTLLYNPIENLQSNEQLRNFFTLN